MTVLITGGTGTLGRSVRSALLAARLEPRVLSRQQKPESESAASWVTGNLESGAGLDDALRGVDTIIHCATNGRSDVESTRTLIAAATRAGNPHLIYISIVGVDRHPLKYYQSKLEVERLIEHSGLPWTVLRATQFHTLVATLFDSQRWLPVIFAPTFSFQSIAAEEVAERLAELAASPPAGRVDDMGGPQVETSHNLAAAYVSATSGHRRIVPLKVPGKVFAAYQRGVHLTPEHRDGNQTFSEFLAHRAARSSRR